MSHFEYLREDGDDVFKRIEVKDIVQPKQMMETITMSDRLVLEDEIKEQKQQDAYYKHRKPLKMKPEKWGSWLTFKTSRERIKEAEKRDSIPYAERHIPSIYSDMDNTVEDVQSMDMNDQDGGTRSPLLHELGKGSSSRGSHLLGEKLEKKNLRARNENAFASVYHDEDMEDATPRLNLGRRYDVGLKFDRTRPSLKTDRYTLAWSRAEIEPRKLHNGNFDTRPILEFDLAKTDAPRYLGGERYKSTSSPPTSNWGAESDFASSNPYDDVNERNEEMKSGAELVYGNMPLGDYSRQSRSAPAFRYMTTWQEVYDAFKILEGDSKTHDISQAFHTLKQMKPYPPHEALVEMAEEAIKHGDKMMPISLTNTLHACAKMKFLHVPLLRAWELQLNDPKVLEACTDLDITCLVYSFGVLTRLWRQKRLTSQTWEVALTFEFIEKLAHEALHPIRLDNYSHSMLVNIFYGFSLLKFNKAETLNKLLDRITKDDMMLRMEVSNLSALIYGIGYLKFWSPDMTTRILREALSKISEFNTQALANLLWSLGNVRYPKMELVGQVAKECAQEHHLRNCSEQDLTSIVYGMAMCKFRDPAILGEYVTEIMRPGRLANMHDVRLTNLLCSFATLHYTNDLLTRALIYELSSPQRVKKLENMHISSAFYALGSIRFRHPHVLEKLADEILDPDRLPTFGESDLATIIFAIGNMKIINPTFVDALMNEAGKEQRLSHYSALDVANMINACSLLRYNNEQFLSNLCDALTDEKRFRQLTPSGISLATLGLCRLQFYHQNFFSTYLQHCTSAEKIQFMRPSTLIDIMFGSLRAQVVDFAHFLAIIQRMRDPKLLENLMNFPLVRIVNVASLLGLRDEEFLTNLKQEVLKKERLECLRFVDQRDLARAFERMTFFDEELCKALNYGPRIQGHSVGILAPGALQKIENEEKMREMEKEKEEKNFDWTGRLKPTFYE